MGAERSVPRLRPGCHPVIQSDGGIRPSAANRSDGLGPVISPCLGSHYCKGSEPWHISPSILLYPIAEATRKPVLIQVHRVTLSWLVKSDLNYLGSAIPAVSVLGNCDTMSLLVNCVGTLLYAGFAGRGSNHLCIDKDRK